MSPLLHSSLALLALGLAVAAPTLASDAMPADALRQSLAQLPAADQRQLETLPAARAWEFLFAWRPSPVSTSELRDESGRVIRPASTTTPEFTPLASSELAATLLAARLEEAREHTLRDTTAAVATAATEALTRHLASHPAKGPRRALVVARTALTPAPELAALEPRLQPRLASVGDAIGRDPRLPAGTILAAAPHDSLGDTLRHIGGGSDAWTARKGLFGASSVRLANTKFAAEDVLVLVAHIEELRRGVCEVTWTLRWHLHHPRLQPGVAVGSGETTVTAALHPTRGWLVAAPQPGL